MKAIWIAPLAALLSFPLAAAPIEINASQLFLGALSTVSYDATLDIWNQHAVSSRSVLNADGVTAAADISLTYDLTVSVDTDMVVHGGTLTVIGMSPTLGILSPTTLLLGHLDGSGSQFVYDGFSFKSNLFLDFAIPEFIFPPAIAFTNTPGVPPPPFNGLNDWTNGSWVFTSLDSSAAITIFSLVAIPEPATLELILPGLLILGLSRKRVSALIRTCSLRRWSLN